MVVRVAGKLRFDSARSGGDRGGQARRLVFSGRRLSVDVVVRPDGGDRGSLEGRVVDEDSGRPVPGARVQHGDAEAVATDASGHFGLGGVPLRGIRPLWVLTPETDLLCEIPVVEFCVRSDAGVHGPTIT